MKYEAVIGLEVHIELETKSKMFCKCSADYFTARPNTHTCPVCLGLPGAMPVANKTAVEYAQKFGLALGCKIREYSKFARKNYFYPDLAKGFQISQYDLPFSEEGQLTINIEGSNKKIGITRAHLEEDTGKLTHAKVKDKEVTLIDFNRSGVPLLEIVSDPVMRSSVEAKSYAQKLQQMARYLEVSGADMEKGSMRVEPNVSLREKSRNRGIEESKLPDYKVELKNINSFKFAQRAINYEIERQKKLLEKGEKLIQETRGWNEKENKTVSQRSKEEVHDYRYFPEPDIPPLRFLPGHVSKLKTKLPELPEQKQQRFTAKYKLSTYDNNLLTYDKSTAEFFEEVVKAYKGEAKKVSNWITGELLRRLNEKKITIKEIDLLPASLAELIYLIDKGELTHNVAKGVLVKMLESGKGARVIIKSLGISKMSSQELKDLVKKTVKNNKKAANDFKAGKKASIGFLIGQVQNETKGSSDVNEVKRLLLEVLKID